MATILSVENIGFKNYSRLFSLCSLFFIEASTLINMLCDEEGFSINHNYAFNPILEDEYCFDLRGFLDEVLHDPEVESRIAHALWVLRNRPKIRNSIGSSEEWDPVSISDKWLE